MNKLWWLQSPSKWEISKSEICSGKLSNIRGAGGEGVGRGDRDGEDMWTQGLFISMYDKIHYKKKKKY